MAKSDESVGRLDTRQRGNPIDQTGAQVAQNVKRFRTKKEWSLAVVAQRMTDRGRTINASGVQKIESGARRVDVDDLMALAMALDVTPNALLLPGSYSDTEAFAVSGAHDAWTGRRLWEWARGNQALPITIPDTDVARAIELLRHHEFLVDSNPDHEDNHGDD